MKPTAVFISLGRGRHEAGSLGCHVWDLGEFAVSAPSLEVHVWMKQHWKTCLELNVSTLRSGPLTVRIASLARLLHGKIAGAALDVFEKDAVVDNVVSCLLVHVPSASLRCHARPELRSLCHRTPRCGDARVCSAAESFARHPFTFSNLERAKRIEAHSNGGTCQILLLALAASAPPVDFNAGLSEVDEPTQCSPIHGKTEPQKHAGNVFGDAFSLQKA